jgi:hypothetical protein
MRKTLIILGGRLAILFGLYAGFKGYKAAKIRRLIAAVHAYRDKADDKNALLSLRQAAPRKQRQCQFEADSISRTREAQGGENFCRLRL